MAWTQQDVDRLRAAVSSGIMTVSYDGPPRRSITYHSLDAMRDLLREMEAEVEGRIGHRLASFNGGFR